jgi:hypothetical protein
MFYYYWCFFLNTIENGGKGGLTAHNLLNTKAFVYKEKILRFDIKT